MHLSMSVRLTLESERRARCAGRHWLKIEQHATGEAWRRQGPLVPRLSTEFSPLFADKPQNHVPPTQAVRNSLGKRINTCNSVVYEAGKGVHEVADQIMSAGLQGTPGLTVTSCSNAYPQSLAQLLWTTAPKAVPVGVAHSFPGSCTSCSSLRPRLISAISRCSGSRCASGKASSSSAPSGSKVSCSISASCSARRALSSASSAKRQWQWPRMRETSSICWPACRHLAVEPP